MKKVKFTFYILAYCSITSGHYVWQCSIPTVTQCCILHTSLASNGIGQKSLFLSNCQKVELQVSVYMSLLHLLTLTTTKLFCVYLLMLNTQLCVHTFCTSLFLQIITQICFNVIVYQICVFLLLGFSCEEIF